MKIKTHSHAISCLFLEEGKLNSSIPWEPTWNDVHQWHIVDLGSEKIIMSVITQGGGTSSPGNYVEEYDVEVKIDGVWVPVNGSPFTGIFRNHWIIIHLSKFM